MKKTATMLFIFAFLTVAMLSSCSNTGIDLKDNESVRLNELEKRVSALENSQDNLSEKNNPNVEDDSIDLSQIANQIIKEFPADQNRELSWSVSDDVDYWYLDRTEYEIRGDIEVKKETSKNPPIIELVEIYDPYSQIELIVDEAIDEPEMIINDTYMIVLGETIDGETPENALDILEAWLDQTFISHPNFDENEYSIVKGYINQYFYYFISNHDVAQDYIENLLLNK